MKLSGHPGRPVELADAVRDGADAVHLDKYRRNVLKHVLGFQYPKPRWRNQGWHQVMEVPAAVRYIVEARLDDLSLLEGVHQLKDDRALAAAARDPEVQAAIDPELVPAYRALVEAMGQRWTSDYHWPNRKYMLVDGSGGMLIGRQHGVAVRVHSVWRADGGRDVDGASLSPAARANAARWQAEDHLEGGEYPSDIHDREKN